MSQNGFIVFTATPEMAKQTNRALRSGMTYVAQPAKVAKMVDDSAPTPKATKKTTKKKVAKKTKAKAKAKKATKKKVVKKTSKPKATERTAIQPEAIIKFVQENDGCNMTDIEAAIKAPQSRLRRVINQAREAGDIVTTGQRRGLRYHIPTVAGADN